MKTVLALVAGSLLALSLAPSGQAAEVAGPDVDFPFCQEAVVGTLCFSPYWPGCNLWIEWTAIPAPPTCLYRSDPVASSAAGPGFECMDVYSRTNVHTYSIVRRDSCAAPEVYECPTPGAPISTCRALLGFSASAAAPAEPDCFYMYRETHLGPVTIIQRSSCDADVYVCGEQDLHQVDPTRCPLDLPVDVTAAAAGPGLDCMPVYSRTDVATISVVRRTSCSPPEVYECPYEGAPISACRPLLQADAAAAQPGVDLPPIHCMPYEREVDLGGIQVVQGGCGSYVRVCGDRVTADWDGDVGCLAADFLASSSASETACLDVYHEAEVGPVRIVSRDSCHAEATVCDRDLETLTDPMQTDDLWQRRCVEETLDRYIAWT